MKYKEGHRPHNYRHGLSHTPTHNSWISMRSRCENANNNRYKYYGGRGIRVCDRWQSFDCFLEDMGVCPAGMSIDRIDVNGNYEPGNCRWATDLQQGEHRSNAVLITYNGKTQNARAWAREVGLSYMCVIKRYHRGWTPEQILTTPEQDNCSKRMNNKSGYKGVYFDGRKYRVQIRKDGTTLNFGSFVTPQEASAVHDAKYAEIYPDRAKNYLAKRNPIAI